MSKEQPLDTTESDALELSKDADANNTTLLNTLLDAQKPTLLALDSATLVRPLIVGARAVVLTNKVGTGLQAFKDQIEKEFSKARAAEILDGITIARTRSLLFFRADTLAEQSWTPDLVKKKREVAKQVKEFETTLELWAPALLDKFPSAKEELERIKRGRGYQDDAVDVLDLVALYKQWGVGTVEINDAYLTLAETTASVQIKFLNQQEESAGSPLDIRRRAFTLWVNLYNDLVAVGRYLLRNDPDRNDKFPGARSEVGSTYKSDKPQIPAPPAPPDTGTSGTPVN